MRTTSPGASIMRMKYATREKSELGAQQCHVCVSEFRVNVMKMLTFVSDYPIDTDSSHIL